MAKHKVEISGISTNDIVVLTAEETKELFKKYKEENDLNAKEKLVNGNLKLVLSIIKKFNNRGENLDDLFQVGCIGLVNAIDNFDLSFNVKLSTYAVPMILGEIKRYLRDNNSLRVSRSVKDLAYSVLKEKENLTNKLGRDPSLDEISNSLGASINEIANSLDAISVPISIFEPIYSDGGDTIYLYDQIATKESINKDLDINLAVEDAINELDKRSRKIIEERYIIGKTQMEIACELGISQAQISRIEKDAIKSLKKVLK